MGMLHPRSTPPKAEVGLQWRRDRGRLNPNMLKLRDFSGVLRRGHDFVEQSRRRRD
jgi:hypothetical protein